MSATIIPTQKPYSAPANIALHGLRKGFTSKTEAQAWVKAFVNWYNAEHLHSALRFVTPNSRHAGEECQMLAKRADLYAKARASNPQRWSGIARN